MAISQPLSGPIHEPASGGAATELVVLLHGLGADGNDLIGLAPFWAEQLPDAEFISPDAPFPCDMAPYGRQWFSLQDRSPATVLGAVREAAPSVDAFLDAALAARGLANSALALVGFSQGAIMALHIGLRRKEPPACILGYSGALVGADILAADIRAKPPVLLIHGDADPVVPPAALPAAVKALKGCGIAVEELVRPGLGHAIDEIGLARGGAFLRASLSRAAR